MQGSGNGRRRQCQYIDIYPHFLQLIFDFDAKLLFFINDQQTQILKFNVLVDDSVNRYLTITFTSGRLLDEFLNSFGRSEAVYIVPFPWKTPYTIFYSLVMLHGQNSSRH